MALVVGTDSYVSLAEATTYGQGQLGAAAFHTATAGVREAALLMACERLERLFYLGRPAESTQRLRWPRTGLYDQHGVALPAAVVPQFVKDAQVWEAVYLAEWHERGAGRSTREAWQKQGVASAQLRDVQETYRPEQVDSPLRCCLGPAAWAMLAPYVAFGPAGLREGV